MSEERRTLTDEEILTTGLGERHHDVMDADEDDADADTDDSDADADTDDAS